MRSSNLYGSLVENKIETIKKRQYSFKYLRKSYLNTDNAPVPKNGKSLVNKMPSSLISDTANTAHISGIIKII